MKELKTEFIGVGEVKGFKFTQLSANSQAFIYKVEQTPTLVHYEVFRRIVNEK